MTMIVKVRILVVLPLLLGAAGRASAAGVVVEEVQPGFAAHDAGLKPGDVLLGWERAASPPANPEPAGGELHSPFDLEDVEREQAPRGRVTLRGTRGDAAVVAVLAPGDWKMEARPSVPDADDPATATWRLVKAGRAAADKKDWPAADAAFAAAVREADAAGDPLVIASVQGARGRYHDERSQWEPAVAAYREALTAHRARAPVSLGEAWAHTFLGIVARKRGDLPVSEAELRQALAIREKLAPDSLVVASTLGSLGIAARNQGDLAAAEEYQRRALAIRERLAPESLDVAAGLNNLGVVLSTRADLAGAEEHFRHALAIRERLQPDTNEVAAIVNNLGTVAETHGDLPAAEDYYRRAMAIHAKHLPHGLGVAMCLGNLGNLAARRGDLAGADAHYRDALAIKDELAPRSLAVASVLNSAAEVAWRRGLLPQAREHIDRALAIFETLAPTSIAASDTWQVRGDVAASEGDLAAAEAHYRRALEIRQQRAPGSALEAESSQRLATVRRRTGKLDDSLGFYLEALSALDSQRTMFGGTDEARSRFTVRYAAYYREALDVLMEMGRPQEAFHVLERYRARGLLSMLAERDLVFSADVPEDLDRQRRMINTAYDQGLARLGDAKGADLEAKREALAAIRREQGAIQDRIRAASPRLAELHYPQPLDLPATREALDPGTLLLSYSIGDDKSYLFAVGPGKDDFTAVPLKTSLGPLREEVTRFRRLLQGPRRLGAGPLHATARRLSALLLAPVAPAIVRAERVLVLPDGPLHLIPFGVLADPTGRHRYLVEARPVFVAASATVFAEIRKKRRADRPPSLVAFGDPDYSAAAPGLASPSAALPGLRSALDRGLALRPLPATRREVDALKSLYPLASRTYVGAEATEEAAKSVKGDASLVHFACHGLADESSPLESSLALAVPRGWQPGRDNGLLQAWEIFERVRIDAELVTLSACSTALGKEMSGEGMLGLTRAFQYAGARSVLASLWEVGDDSTAELMRRFYGYLKDGRTKDEALRAAQLQMIRRPATAHPHGWAAFQVLGDWR